MANPFQETYYNVGKKKSYYKTECVLDPNDLLQKSHMDIIQELRKYYKETESEGKIAFLVHEELNTLSQKTMKLSLPELTEGLFYVSVYGERWVNGDFDFDSLFAIEVNGEKVDISPEEAKRMERLITTILENPFDRFLDGFAAFRQKEED